MQLQLGLDSGVLGEFLGFRLGRQEIDVRQFPLDCCALFGGSLCGGLLEPALEIGIEHRAVDVDTIDGRHRFGGRG